MTNDVGALCSRCFAGHPASEVGKMCRRQGSHGMMVTYCSGVIQAATEEELRVWKLRSTIATMADLESLATRVAVLEEVLRGR